MAAPVHDPKAAERRKAQSAYFAYLDRRVPVLHRQGVQGRLARVQADQEYARGWR